MTCRRPFPSLSYPHARGRQSGTGARGAARPGSPRGAAPDRRAERLGIAAGAAGIAVRRGRRSPCGAGLRGSAAPPRRDGECERLQRTHRGPGRLRSTGSRPVATPVLPKVGALGAITGGVAEFVSPPVPGTGNAYRRPPRTARIGKRGAGRRRNPLTPFPVKRLPAGKKHIV